MIHHVVPINDIQPHNTYDNLNCWCNPRNAANENGDMVVIHNSADGREWPKGPKATGVLH